MTILQSDLKWKKSENVSNTPGNGGKMGAIDIIGGVKNNIFDDVSQQDRLDGATFFRKVFAHNANDADEVLINPVLHMKEYTQGQDYVEMFMGTQTDTEADLTGTEQLYGSGTANEDLSAGVPGLSFDVLLEEAVQDIFVTGPGNTIWIGDGVNQEYHEDVTASAPVAGVVTLTLDVADQLSNNYLQAAPTYVASCIYGGVTTLNAYADAVVPTTAGDGDFDDTTYPIQGDNIGCVEGTLTLTFNGGTTFDADLDGDPLVSGGNTGADFIALHPVTGLAMCVVPQLGWTGTWANLDTLVIPLHPSAIPIWLKQTVPAGTLSYSGNNFNMRFGGESA